jgi:hypothetical protein
VSPSSDAARSELFEGGYYSIIDGERFGIAKVLKIDPEIVHVRIYKEHFPRRPRSIDPGQLTLGTVLDKDGFGISHLPLRLEAFASREPLFITHSEVSPNELRGYEAWKAAEGGVWE